MTNQETKDFFQKELECFKPFREQYKSAKQLCEAFENAINALEQQPSDDCVSRKAVLDILSHYAHNFGADAEIKALLPVTPTRKVGKWIYDSGSYKCPFCEHEITGKEDDLNYCCKCGAEMRGTENG